MLRVWIVVTALCCIITMPALADPPGEDAGYDELVAAALEARNAKDYEKVLEYLGRASKLKPSPLLENNIARTLELLGRYKEAHAAYQRVVADESAPADLRALDAARAGALQTRLSKAWILTKASGKVLVGGRPVTPGTESEAAPGKQVFEYQLDGGKTVAIRVETLAAGRRTPVAHDLAASASAVLVFNSVDGVESIEINGYAVKANARHVGRVLLVPGSHAVAVTRQGVLAERRLKLAAGTYPIAKAVPADVAAKPTPIGPVMKHDDGIGAAGWTQIALGTAGAAMVGMGVWMVVDSASLRDEVRNAATNDQGQIVGLSQEVAFEKRSDADNKSTIGLVLLGVGGAAATTALAWWLVDTFSSPDDAQPTMLVPTHNGIRLEGRF